MCKRIVAVGVAVLCLVGSAVSGATADQPFPPGQARFWSHPLVLKWEGITAADAFADLSNRTMQPIWMTDAARQESAQARVHLVARSLNGFQALSVLCRMAGLEWLMVEDVVAVAPAASTPTVWRLGGANLRSRVLGDHPDWNRATPGKPTADVDLVDVTATVAAGQLSETYGLSLVLHGVLRTSQKLITLQGRSVPAREAVSELARQLGAQVREELGVVWLSPPLAHGGAAISQPVRLDTEPPRSRVWRSVQAGQVTAEGWADEIDAMRLWAAEHPQTMKGQPGPGTNAPER